MTSIVLQVAVFLAVPLAALWLERRYWLFEWLNPVVVCYLVGIGLANTPGVPVHGPTAKFLTEATIPLAIPLILFPSDVRAWLGRSRETVVSFLAAVAAVLLSASSAAWLFWGATAEFWKVTGMLVGVYTGGTPNLVSIGMALEAQEETFVLLNAADVFLCAIYLLFLVTVAQRVVGWILRSGPDPEELEGRGRGSEHAGDDADDASLDLAGAAPQMAAGFALSAAIVGVSAGATWLVVGEIAVAGVFLGLTTGGIAGSFVDSIRDLAGSYELGNYLILVFCVAMGARTEFGRLIAEGGTILAYTAFVIYASIFVHLLLAYFAEVDVDTFLITSTAAVFGPAFVPAIAEALDNRHVVLSGLTAGLVGYAVANYLGIGLAYLVRP